MLVFLHRNMNLVANEVDSFLGNRMPMCLKEIVTKMVQHLDKIVNGVNKYRHFFVEHVGEFVHMDANYRIEWHRAPHRFTVCFELLLHLVQILLFEQRSIWY